MGSCDGENCRNAFVYNHLHEGPLKGALPAHFEVLLCRGEYEFVVGRHGHRDDRDGDLLAETEAFDPARGQFVHHP
jgi:hypothetical protein